MIQFFQVVFFIAGITLIVLNILQLDKYKEGKKDGFNKYPIRWFNFILTTVVALGCVLNILVGWIENG